LPPSPDASAQAPITVIVAVSDRDIRRSWSQILLDAGYGVRAATRPAEIAKAEADGKAGLILRREHPDDAILTDTARLLTIALSPSTWPEELLTHLRKALAKGER
jgi:hypothetical protein